MAPINASEASLPRQTRAVFCQLRLGYCSHLNDFRLALAPPTAIFVRAVNPPPIPPTTDSFYVHPTRSPSQQPTSGSDHVIWLPFPFHPASTILLLLLLRVGYRVRPLPEPPPQLLLVNQHSRLTGIERRERKKKGRESQK